MSGAETANEGVYTGSIFALEDLHSFASQSFNLYGNRLCTMVLRGKTYVTNDQLKKLMKVERSLEEMVFKIMRISEEEMTQWRKMRKIHS